MEVKLFEVRDRMTMIPMMAIKLGPRSGQERYLLARAGYQNFSATDPHVIMLDLTCNGVEFDPYSWGNRTRQVAHLNIIGNWDTLRSGQVIDVQFILGETDRPETSESITY